MTDFGGDNVEGVVLRYVGDSDVGDVYPANDFVVVGTVSGHKMSWWEDDIAGPTVLAFGVAAGQTAIGISVAAADPVSWSQLDIEVVPRPSDAARAQLPANTTIEVQSHSPLGGKCLCDFPIRTCGPSICRY